MVKKGALARGAGDRVANFVATQVMYETADGTSRVSKADNNYSGIKYTGKKFQKATKGSKSPEGNYYAKYPNMGAWMDDYVRILKMGPGKPFNGAKDLKEYVTKLKMNRYFTDDSERYYQNMAAVYKRYNTSNLPQRPKFDPLKPGNTKQDWNRAKTDSRRQAVEDVRTGVQRDIDADAARKKPKFSLQEWFEKQSALNKAIIIGGAGYVLSRILR